MINYFENEKKRVIVAVLVEERSGLEFKGRAKCSPNDEWNPELGRTIARKRAIMASSKFWINYAKTKRKEQEDIIADIDRFIAKQEKHYDTLKAEVNNL